MSVFRRPEESTEGSIQIWSSPTYRRVRREVLGADEPPRMTISIQLCVRVHVCMHVCVYRSGSIVDPTCYDETRASPFGVSEARGIWSKGIPQLRSLATGSLMGDGRRKVQLSHYRASGTLRDRLSQ